MPWTSPLHERRPIASAIIITAARSGHAGALIVETDITHMKRCGRLDVPSDVVRPRYERLRES